MIGGWAATLQVGWILDKENFFGPDWRFLGHRKTLRYVRPGSRDAARFA